MTDFENIKITLNDQPIKITDYEYNYVQPEQRSHHRINFIFFRIAYSRIEAQWVFHVRVDDPRFCRIVVTEYRMLPHPSRFGLPLQYKTVFELFDHEHHSWRRKPVAKGYVKHWTLSDDVEGDPVGWDEYKRWREQLWRLQDQLAADEPRRTFEFKYKIGDDDKDSIIKISFLKKQ